MKRIKKLLAVSAAIAISLSAAGCTKVSFIAENENPYRGPSVYAEKEEDEKETVKEVEKDKEEAVSDKAEESADESTHENREDAEISDMDISALTEKLEKEDGFRDKKELEKEIERKKALTKAHEIERNRELFEQRAAYNPEIHGPALDQNQPHNIPILIFHEIRKDYNGDIGVIISDKTFKEYMLYLKALNFQTITFQDYLDYREGKKQIAQNSVIVTFDDGYCSNYKIAYPIMEKLGFKFTMSIVGRYIDNSKPEDWESKSLSFVTWDYAEEMEESGVVDIQAHTYNLHNEKNDAQNYLGGVMGVKGESEMAREGRIAGDDIEFQQKMELHIGHKANIFTYPFGFTDAFTDSVYKKRGYVYRLGTEEGISDLRNSDIPLKRINTPVYETPVKVLKKMLTMMGRNSQLPFENIGNQDERIKKLEEITGVSLEEF